MWFCVSFARGFVLLRSALLCCFLGTCASFDRVLLGTSQRAEARRLVFNTQAKAETFRPDRLTDDFVRYHCHVIHLQLDPLAVSVPGRLPMPMHVREVDAKSMKTVIDCPEEVVQTGEVCSMCMYSTCKWMVCRARPFCGRAECH